MAGRRTARPRPARHGLALAWHVGLARCLGPALFRWACCRRKVHAGWTRSPNVLHVLKRWAAWPRGNRWLAGIAAVVLGLAIAWVLFVPIADWLAHHDVGSVRGPLHETAVDNARGRLLTLAAGVFAAGALAFTALNFTLSRDRLPAAGDRSLHQGHRAARLRQARRADRRHLRTGAHRPRLRKRPPDRDRGAHRVYPRALTRAMATARSSRHQEDDERCNTPPRHPSRRYRSRAPEGRTRSLNHPTSAGADLAGADLTRANLANANLSYADLTGANLSDADLTLRTSCKRTSPARTLAARTSPARTSTARDLIRTDLGGADFTGANLDDADFTGARSAPF